MKAGWKTLEGSVRRHTSLAASMVVQHQVYQADLKCLNGRLLGLTLLLMMGLGKPVTAGTFPPLKLTTLAFKMPI